MIHQSCFHHVRPNLASKSFKASTAYTVIRRQHPFFPSYTAIDSSIVQPIGVSDVVLLSTPAQVTPFVTATTVTGLVSFHLFGDV